MQQLIAERWHEEVSGAHRYLAFDSGNFAVAEPDPQVDARAPVSGWFAYYEGRQFAVLQISGTSSQFAVACGSMVVVLHERTTLKWRSTLGGRTLEIHEDGRQLLRFDYRSALRYLLHPLRFLREVILADDWWGLTCDLPGFVHSTASRPGGLAQALADWNARRTKGVA